MIEHRGSCHCGRIRLLLREQPGEAAYPRIGVNLRMFEPATWSGLPRRAIDGAGH